MTRNSDGNAKDQLWEFWQNRKKNARKIVHDLESGTYQFDPVECRDALLAGKVRKLFKFSFRDQVVHQMAARVLGPLAEMEFSEKLWSYRKKRGTRTALWSLRDYVKQHRKKNPDPKSRGIYAWKADVSNYGDSIPIHPESRLWADIDRLMQSRPGLEWLRKILPDLVRPRLKDESMPILSVGLPTGSPLVPILGNLYLGQLDQMLNSREEHVFYGRYGDDFVFATPVAEEFESKLAEARKLLASLDLSINPKKERFFYWNGAGRKSPEGLFKGTHVLTWLGIQCDFSGQLRIDKEKRKEFLDEFMKRLVRSRNLLKNVGVPEDRHLDLIGKIFGTAFNGKNQRLRPNGLLDWFLIIDDRKQLRELDLDMCARVARALRPEKNFKHRSIFRNLRPREIFSHGFPSILGMKNGSEF